MEIIYLALGVMAVLVVLAALISKPKPSKKKYKKGSYAEKKESKADYYAEQQERVNVGGYEVQALLNYTEQVARKAIWSAIFDAGKKNEMDLYAQVCLGEILKHENNKLYNDISCKRVDFVIVDRKFKPLATIEVHGQGHYQNSATKRDTIKRTAIENAGIKYIAIAVGNDKKKITEAIHEKMQAFFVGKESD